MLTYRKWWVLFVCLFFTREEERETRSVRRGKNIRVFFLIKKNYLKDNLYYDVYHMNKSKMFATVL